MCVEYFHNAAYREETLRLDGKTPCEEGVAATAESLGIGPRGGF